MFPVHRLVYELNASCPIILHETVPSITLRGAFGYALLQLLAREEMIPELHSKMLLFRDFFMPTNDGRSTATHHDLPRPFLIRGSYTRPDCRSFIVEIILWGEAIQYESIFDRVLELIAIMGVGRNHVECRLEKLHSLPVPIEFPNSVFSFRANFITPTVRVSWRQRIWNEEIPFPALFARFLDRFDEIDRVYGERIGIPEAESAALKKMAQNVESHRIRGGCVGTSRTSSRTGQTMKLAGFAGQMEYIGDFSPFAPYLGYLPWIHIGHCSTFGCGWISLCCQLITSETR